jgi:hypothetical protein
VRPYSDEELHGNGESSVTAAGFCQHATEKTAGAASESRLLALCLTGLTASLRLSWEGKRNKRENLHPA